MTSIRKGASVGCAGSSSAQPTQLDAFSVEGSATWEPYWSRSPIGTTTSGRRGTSRKPCANSKAMQMAKALGFGISGS